MEFVQDIFQTVMVSCLFAVGVVSGIWVFAIALSKKCNEAHENILKKINKHL